MTSSRRWPPSASGNIDVRTLVSYGNTVCAAVNADAADLDAATAAAKSAASLDDATGAGSAWSVRGAGEGSDGPGRGAAAA